MSIVRDRGNARVFGVAGLLLGLGSPIGAILLRLFSGGPEALRSDFPEHAFFYVYMTLGTCMAFTAAGILAGHLVDRLMESRERYRALSEVDTVTHLLNRRGFEAAHERLVALASRERLPIACLYLDCDDFKRFNDRHGHPAGDEVLKAAGRVLSRVSRTGDVAARVGGDEFVLLIAGASARAAEVVADRIRAELLEEPIPVPGLEVRPTLSIGLAWADDDRGRARVVEDADHALLAVKKERRALVP